MRKFIFLAPLLFISEHALALYLDNEQKTLNGISLPETVEMTNNSVLTVNGGGTREIKASGGSQVNLNNAVITSSGFAPALALSDSTAVINGGTISSARGNGLEVGRPQGSTTGGSQAQVNGASISGQVGTNVSGLSELHLDGSQVTGNAFAGARVFGGTLSASNGSVIQGATNGIELYDDTELTTASTLNLDNSSVIGLDGSAILVDSFSAGTEAIINISNGSSLTGSNGRLLEVNGGAVATFNVSNSNLTGDVVVEEGSEASVNLTNNAVLTGRLENVQSVGIDNHAQWVLVEDSSVGDLDMSNGGSIKFGQPGDFYKLSVENLSGAGTFLMEADFSKGQSDMLEVTGNATGNHDILVTASGSDPLSDGQLHLVHIAGGDAQFSLVGGEVDLGTWSYGLTQVGNDWFLDATTRKISPGARTALAIFEAGPTVLYGELSTLRSRMGEIRLNDGKAGLWMRSYGNKFNVNAQGSSYSQVQQGVAFGADAPMPWGEGQWLVGLLGGYSTSDLDMGRGTSGKIDSYYAGIYSTWLQPESGFYVDSVLKFNRFQNKADVRMSDGVKAKGDFDNGAVSASVEVGRHIKLKDDWFVEPYGQVIGAVIEGQSYDLDNGMQVDGNRTRSLLGKVGVTVGRDILLDNQMRVQPYLRTALAHEFINNNEARVNDNRFDNDLSGSRGELGAGIAVSLSDRVQIHADFDYSNGDRIEQPWGANVGVRYTW
ncbi:autotransporter outer membrane beta-barrel domain-containing protein [Pseudomonas wadenswilerensis]